jgi:hypothetical protein
MAAAYMEGWRKLHHLLCWANSFFAMKKVGFPFWPSKFLKLINDHGLKFLLLSGNYDPFCKLTVLNRWKKIDLPLSINLLILNCFMDMWSVWIFFKTTIPSQMKQPTLITNTRSLDDFEMEDMIYPYLYGCANGARACSCSKPPTAGGRVTACSCSKPIVSFG